MIQNNIEPKRKNTSDGFRFQWAREIMNANDSAQGLSEHLFRCR